MFEDVVVGEVIECCPCITDSIIDSLCMFEEALDEFEQEYVICSKGLISDELIDYANNVAHVEDKLMLEARDKLEENSNYLEKINKEIRDLKTLEQNLNEAITDNKKEVNVLKGKIESLNKKKDNLCKSRDIIQICKLITNTYFTYNKESTISGYAVGKISKKIRCFELDSEKISQSDITDSLYEVIKKDSSKDPQDQNEKCDNNEKDAN